MRACIPVFLWMFLILAIRAEAPQKPVQKVAYCDLISGVAEYEGSRVTVFAVYSYGFEWHELLCTECRSVGQLTWVEFNEDHEKELRKQLRKAPKHHGIIAAHFTGVFKRRAGGSYGGYRFEFTVDEISDLTVLVRDFKTPLASVPTCCKLLERPPGKQ